MNDHLQLVRRVPLFEALSDDDLAALEACLLTRSVRAGELLFSKGDAGTSMFIIISGRVKIFLPNPERGHDETVLEELKPGAFFGEMALLDNCPRMASVEAQADSDLLELTHTSFLSLLKNSPHIGAAMLAVMSNRLRVAAQLLDTTAARDINKESDDRLTWAQRLADKVAKWNGSWSFILILVALTLIWVESNAIAALRFDPYPYQFFNLFLAILVALQGPLIMMSQNRQITKERLHAEADFQVNLKNEIGIVKIQQELATLHNEMSLIRQEMECLRRHEST